MFTSQLRSVTLQDLNKRLKYAHVHTKNYKGQSWLMENHMFKYCSIKMFQRYKKIEKMPQITASINLTLMLTTE